MPYPFPENITREEFRKLVAELRHKLTANGLDPALNLGVKDFDEIVDGKPSSRFGIFISETAAEILEHK